jgi:hypothetical protein
MLAAYPCSLYRKWGHCRTALLLDACEQETQDATQLAIHASLFSTYKDRPTLKFLAGCGGIGETWAALIPDGFPGAISDPAMMKVTDILKNCPFGWNVEVDKGFVVDNEGAKLGVGIQRPPKMLRNQVQQSPEDTHTTEKVGNTRIPVEQMNGAGKAAAGYLNSPVPILQLGLASMIFRTTFLLQNFKYGFTQGHSGSCEGRPCKAEICWYGATEDGLFDARPQPKLWATRTELYRWKELRAKHHNLTDTEISELVLDENIPDRLRKEHIAKIRAMRQN